MKTPLQDWLKEIRVWLRASSSTTIPRTLKRILEQVIETSIRMLKSTNIYNVSLSLLRNRRLWKDAMGLINHWSTLHILRSLVFRILSELINVSLKDLSSPQERLLWIMMVRLSYMCQSLWKQSIWRPSGKDILLILRVKLTWLLGKMKIVKLQMLFLSWKRWNLMMGSLKFHQARSPCRRRLIKNELVLTLQISTREE